ncbi:MAG: hypothetical protein L3J11_09910 [Draconibacterium sp.]|nr:hypothetical protein [Draconibacterium sp.]
MKAIYLVLFLLIYSLTSCQKQNNETNGYLSEYSTYKSVVLANMSTIEIDLADSITIMVDELVVGMPYLSCMYCAAEGVVEIPNFFKLHHEVLIFIADRVFRGKDGRLKFIFQTMFKEFYPEEYDLLLEESNIPKAVEWRDIDKEYKLPMEKLFEKYIELEFNTE